MRSIVIIDIDTLRADHLGCYGYRRATSPTIDALADRAARFEWAFSQAPNTPPSQASILTGLYPSTHGMIYDDNRIPEAVSTLAEVLSAAGYATYGIHDGGYLRPDFGFDQGFDSYDDQQRQGLRTGLPAALEKVRQHQPGQPFLLFLHTYDTHTPYAPPEEYRGLFLGGIDEPTPGFEPTSEAMEAIRTSVWTDNPISIEPVDVEYSRALYDAEIRYVDDKIREFFEAIEADVPVAELIVVVISDHGEEFTEHGSVLHEKLYSTVTRVPLIIDVPGFPDGVVHRDPVETVDLMPTLLDLVGVPIPEAVQGDSLVSELLGQAVQTRPAYSESPFFGERRAVARGLERLLMTRSTGAVEFFNIDQDPLELTDISEETDQTRIDEMTSLISAWQGRVDAARVPQDEQATMSPETEEQLRALGYIQ